MQFRTISFLTISMLASSLVGAMIPGMKYPTPPTNNFAEEAYRKTLERGIDPNGPRPNDIISDNGKCISFEEDSKFALWAAAQNTHAVGLQMGAGSEVDSVYELDLYLPGWEANLILNS
ncbi:hypothetical protein BDD12DRAFT_810869 [Trichophaea hybrida]|nr:hypothetical protein BDD12DRAFT_810869 [Trichophaea hybrida]